MDNVIKKDRKDIIQYINMQLAALGQPLYIDNDDIKNQLSHDRIISLTEDLIKSFREKSRLLSDYLSPADQRIQNFIDSYLEGLDVEIPRIPNNTFTLNQPGLARELSLPPDGDTFKNELVSSYRLKQGILNNPSKDKRTTEGTFHIVDSGLPVPTDKKEVPRHTFAHMLKAAIESTEELKTLPFTANQEKKAKVMLSLLLRPVVSPEVKGIMPEKSMEIRFFVPGSLVSNLDFVENIFGNAGDPNLAMNDSGLDVEHWTGHTGCIILAPHLNQLKKKEIGLPHYDNATERQRKDGMCYKSDDELYNNGGAFKLTCRDERGVVITLVADNYYGYSKKEIKTQIGYSANLYGLVEEEHAGGAIAFPCGNMMDCVYGDIFLSRFNGIYSFEKAIELLGNNIEVKPEGYAVDKKYPDIIYIHEHANFNIDTNNISWKYNGQEHELKLSPKKTYVYPSGHKLTLTKHPYQNLWRLVDTGPEGVFCHKPSTVSGGGKSEISKSLQNAIKYGSFYINNLEEDSKQVDILINMDYSKRWKNIRPDANTSRPLLSPLRTLGSVVKLLTPNEQYNDEYNEFLRNIPFHIRTMVLFIKRLYRTDENTSTWKDKFSVDYVNGREGHTLLYNNAPVISSNVRIGFTPDDNWLLHKLRSDFIPARKIQMEDDITASITLPANQLKKLNAEFPNKSVKITTNCERYFFQRPDEAVVRGYDKDAERDLVSPDTFITNYEPLTQKDAVELYENAIHFEKYTQPVKDFITSIVMDEDPVYFVTPSHTRIVNGEPTKNPRYLEKNTHKGDTFENYLADAGIRLHRGIKADEPVYHPVNAVLPGRRNNPADHKSGIRSLAVYNPIHYQELPELFMDFICSLTGKSPSTTGAGSEGALTKGPFNMLTATTDLNNALLSYILTEYQGFSSAAGYIGNGHRFDHDISILIPEIWSRLVPEDRNPELLIENGCLEKLNDFDYNGQKVLASRLGYRITQNFAFRCMNRLFDEPLTVFSETMLKPELQGMEDFVDGINNIVEAQKKVALEYFADGSVESAIPPLKILLHIMAYGHYEGKEISDSELRTYFTRDYVIQSDWYKERLKLKQVREVKFLQQQLASLEAFNSNPKNSELVKEMDIAGRIASVKMDLANTMSDSYLVQLEGTIGLDPLFKKK